MTNKVVLVAGSSRGIGYAAARAFLAEGCRTAITGREPAALAQAQATLESEFGTERVLAYGGDLRQAAAIVWVLASVGERWGPLDCLVANIGSGQGPVGWDVQEPEWHSLFEENLWGSVRLIREVLPAMTRSRQGSIVVVASVTGLESTSAPMPYSAAKAALVNYSKNLARQVGSHNVRVNCVAPGNVLFPGGSWDRHLSKHRDEVMRHVAAEVPLQRFGKAEEIADLIVFLSSERASFITGACVVADGGQTRSP